MAKKKLPILKRITDRVEAEPALFLGLCSVLINTFVIFGLRLNADQVSQLNILIAAMVAFSVRQQVTPNVSLPKRR